MWPFLRVYGWMMAVVVLAVALLFLLVDPTPPREIEVATGSTNGAYHAFGLRLAERLSGEGLKVWLVPTAGSMENLGLLRSEEGAVSMALVQSGLVVSEAVSDDTELRSLGSLFLEPMWVFHRRSLVLTSLRDLAGKRVAVGVEGSGTLPAARAILEANGLLGAGADRVDAVRVGGEEAAEELLAGRLDAACFVAAPGNAVVNRLLREPELDFHGLRRGGAYQATFPRLMTLEIGEGQLDLAANVPDTDKTVLAAAVTLVVNDRYHPGLTPLILDAAAEVLRDGGALERPGEFPASYPTDFELLSEADHYHRFGPPFLMRYLPFWVATVAFRIVILVIPLLALLIPLVRITPPLYVWRTRARIYRWYKHLREIDQRIESGTINATVDEDIAGLLKLENEILKVQVPLSYADELYDLHLHIEWVLRRLERLKAGNRPTSDPPRSRTDV
ncbi:MAG: ABC transporter substrate-binding protein [Verrucomicrobia bacterium]|nr:ABC transporter substrate-binding protein [Verrucomicrobiota bacterium]